MSQKSGTPKLSSEQVVIDIRRASRRQYSAKEKVRIVLDDLLHIWRIGHDDFRRSTTNSTD